MEGDAWTAPGGDYDKVNTGSMSQIPYGVSILTYAATNSSECKVDPKKCKMHLRLVTSLYLKYCCVLVGLRLDIWGVGWGNL